jgi:hypothetical protein
MNGVNVCVTEFIVRENDANTIYLFKYENNIKAGRTTIYNKSIVYFEYSDVYKQDE